MGFRNAFTQPAMSSQRTTCVSEPVYADSMKPMSWIMWPPLTESASNVSAASAAACWSGSLPSVTPPSVHIGRPYQCRRLEYTAR